jgi:AraC-like DNA-binding protein
VHDGKLKAGMAVLTGAGLPSCVEFNAACDFIHLFVPRQRLQQIADETADNRESESIEPVCIASSDPVVERLAWLLLKAGDHEGCSSDVFLDGIAAAIVTRILNGHSAASSPSARTGLVKWRLKRVQEFIEGQLSEPLTLQDLASSAGLSRMHFAAQFRAATGMRPHEYLVRRRIEHAQEALLTTGMPLVEVALSVGFQTQAHFTTVFRRFLGETPGRWRQAQRLV